MFAFGIIVNIGSDENEGADRSKIRSEILESLVCRSKIRSQLGNLVADLCIPRLKVNCPKGSFAGKRAC